MYQQHITFNCLNSSIKRQRFSDWNKNKIYAANEKKNATLKLKYTKCKKIENHTNTIQKEGGITILLVNNIKFRSKNITKHEEDHRIIIKVSIHQKEIVVINVYAPKHRPLKNMKVKPMQYKEK